jgi:hypothetical protein
MHQCLESPERPQEDIYRNPPARVRVEQRGLELARGGELEGREAVVAGDEAGVQARVCAVGDERECYGERAAAAGEG